MKRLNESGAVALLSVAVFMTIITVITTVYIRTALVQQRDSIAYDNSNKALYASLVGFEDTKRAIATGAVTPGPTNKKSDCPVVNGASDAGNFAPNLNLSYTCQLIQFTPNQLEASQISTNSTVVFPIQTAGTTGNYELRLTWTPGRNARGSSGKSLPTQGYWQTASPGGAPPMVRSQVISYLTADSNLTREEIESQSFYLNPSTGTGNNAIDSTPATVDFNSLASWSLPNEPIKNVLCSQSGTEFSCEGRIQLSNVNFGQHTVFLALKAVYTKIDSIKVELLNDGTPVPLTSGQAVIDITGKSGSVFKRTQQTAPYGTYPVTFSDSADFALIGGEGICKQMSLSAVGSRSQFACSADSP